MVGRLRPIINLSICELCAIGKYANASPATSINNCSVNLSFSYDCTLSMELNLLHLIPQGLVRAAITYASRLHPNCDHHHPNYYRLLRIRPNCDCRPNHRHYCHLGGIGCSDHSRRHRSFCFAYRSSCFESQSFPKNGPHWSFVHAVAYWPDYPDVAAGNSGTADEPLVEPVGCSRYSRSLCCCHIFASRSHCSDTRCRRGRRTYRRWNSYRHRYFQKRWRIRRPCRPESLGRRQQFRSLSSSVECTRTYSLARRRIVPTARWGWIPDESRHTSRCRDCKLGLRFVCHRRWKWMPRVHKCQYTDCTGQRVWQSRTHHKQFANSRTLHGWCNH